LIGAGGVGALALLYVLLVALLSLYFENDSHRCQRKVERMADALTHQDLDGAFAHLSDNFRGPANLDKKALRGLADSRISQVQDVKVWDFRFESKPERGKDFDGLVFRVKVNRKGSQGDPWYDCRPTFEFDPVKNEWQLKSFKLLKPGTTDDAWPF
jgi:hypothetical protein